MKNVIIIPTYNRPEFLTLCLEYIMKNKEVNDWGILFALDHGFRRQTLEVIREFRRWHKHIPVETRERNKPPEMIPTMKQSHNLLTAYKEALAIVEPGGLVCLIEDDVFISNITLKWFRLVHEAEPDIYTAIATKNNNVGGIPMGSDLNKYYTIHNSYQSLAPCFKPPMIRLFLSYLKQPYYQDPSRFCVRTFPDSEIKHMYSAQDGFIRRVQEANPQYRIAFPHVPLGFHAGLYSSMGNRGIERFTGTIPEKIQKIKDTCFDPIKVERLLKKAGDPVDSIPVPLIYDDIGPLEKDETIKP